MQSLDIDTDRWLRILLMSLTQPEDSAYWSNFIAGQSNRTWTTDRVHFLTHFDQYDQRLKYQQKFHHLQQRPTESCQSYFDRSAELIRMAHLLFEDPLVLSVVRRGIAHPKLKEYLTIREDTEHPYTFAQLTSYSLMMEDRIATPKPREPSFNKTNDDNSVPSSNKVLTCSYCNRRGHIKADCRRYASSLSRVRDKQPAVGQLSFTSRPTFDAISVKVSIITRTVHRCVAALAIRQGTSILTVPLPLAFYARSKVTRSNPSFVQTINASPSV